MITYVMLTKVPIAQFLRTSPVSIQPSMTSPFRLSNQNQLLHFLFLPVTYIHDIYTYIKVFLQFLLPTQLFLISQKCKPHGCETLKYKYEQLTVNL